MTRSCTSLRQAKRNPAIHDLAPVRGGAAAGPAGTPVSRAIAVPLGMFASDANAVLAAIDAVHGDGALPAIPIRTTGSTVNRGSYRFIPSGQAVDITLSTKGPTPRLTLAHEIGHFLDHQGIGQPGSFATGDRSPGGDLTARWRAAVAQSRAVRELADLSGRLFVDVTAADGTTVRFPVTRGYVSYLMGYDEQWARSYAQYVATKSGDAQMSRDLDAERRRAPGEVYYPAQWDEDDFAPISAAIDELFASLGWIA